MKKKKKENNDRSKTRCTGRTKKKNTKWKKWKKNTSGRTKTRVCLEYKNELEEVFRSLILESRDSSPQKQIRRSIQNFESIFIVFKGGSSGGMGSSSLYRFRDNRAPSLAHLNFYRHGSEQRRALKVSRPAIDWLGRWPPTDVYGGNEINTVM